MKKCTKSGNRVVCDSEGSYIENKATGKIIWLEEDGNLWSLRMRLKSDFFDGRAGWPSSAWMAAAD